MTNEEYLDSVAIAAMGTLLGKLPIPALPSSQQYFGARDEFIRNLSRDCYDLARGMLLASGRVAGLEERRP